MLRVMILGFIGYLLEKKVEIKWVSKLGWFIKWMCVIWIIVTLTLFTLFASVISIGLF